MISYLVRPVKNPADKTVKYYPQSAPMEPVTLEQIADRIEKRSTVSSSDCKAVLDALQYEIIEALKDGKSVRLGDLGSFRTVVKGTGQVQAADVTADDIKSVKVTFTKSSKMRREFNLAAGALKFQRKG